MELPTTPTGKRLYDEANENELDLGYRMRLDILAIEREARAQVAAMPDGAERALADQLAEALRETLEALREDGQDYGRGWDALAAYEEARHD